MEQIFDLIIIGDGPAGLSAAIRAASENLNFIVLDGSDYIGGRMNLIPEVEGVPLASNARGVDLASILYDQAISLGIEFRSENAEFLELTDPIKTVITDESEYVTKSVIIATGVSPKTPDRYNESLLPAAGVSFQAVASSDQYADKTVAIAGSGRTAVESAIYLSDIARTVYLISSKNELSASRSLQDRLFENPNIHYLPGYELGEIIGEEQVEAAWIKNVVTKEKKTLAIDGIILVEETSPNSQLVQNQLNYNYAGYILAGEDCRTSIPYVYAAGDIRNKPKRSIISAICDGQSAIYSLLRDFSR